MKKLITREGFGIVALTILLIPQIAHTVYVFTINSHYQHPWFAWCYAIGVDMAILIYTVKGWKRTSILYFFGTLTHNLVYQFYPEGIYSSILICLMLSGTLFSFTHLFYAEPQQPISPAPPKPDRLETLQRQNIAIEIQPFICPECHKTFSNKKQLNGHISGHKQTKSWRETQYGEWERENAAREKLAQEYDHLRK